MSTLTTKYSSKAAAKKGATRFAKRNESFDVSRATYVENEDGKWTVELLANEEVAEQSEAKVVEPVMVTVSETPSSVIKMPRVLAASLPTIAARIKIEKNRQESCAIVRRSKGTRSEVIWALCDKMDLNNEEITPKTLMAKLAEEGVDMFKNTAVHAMYRWKKFNAK